MSNHHAVDDTLTELIGHVTEAMTRIEQLSGQEWCYGLVATPREDDGMTDTRVTVRPSDDVPGDLRRLAVIFVEMA